MRKTFKFNQNGKIEFTKEELKELLDEVYRAGYDDNSWTYNTPIIWKYEFTGIPSYYTYTTTTSLNSSEFTTSNTTTNGSII